MGAATTVGAGLDGRAREDVGCETLKRWTGLFKPSLVRLIFPMFSTHEEGFNEGDTLWRWHSHDER